MVVSAPSRLGMATFLYLLLRAGTIPLFDPIPMARCTLAVNPKWLLTLNRITDLIFATEHGC